MRVSVRVSFIETSPISLERLGTYAVRVVEEVKPNILQKVFNVLLVCASRQQKKFNPFKRRKLVVVQYVTSVCVCPSCV